MKAKHVVSKSVDGMLFASALESEEAYHMERCEAEEKAQEVYGQIMGAEPVLVQHSRTRRDARHVWTLWTGWNVYSPQIIVIFHKEIHYRVLVVNPNFRELKCTDYKD